MRTETDNLRREWAYREYVNRENLIIHASIEPEMDFYSAVALGREDAVKRFNKEDFLRKEGLGVLSKDSRRNGIYHFVITAALLARECIKSGLSVEEAYSLSDFYIQKADRASSLEEITALHDDMALAYTDKMRALRKKGIYSKPVVKCINFIYSNLHLRITTDMLCKETGLSRSYLSTLFKKETGLTISEYISSRKIETAKNMLLYSDYTPAQISQILGYPSQSYFTECFRKSVGTSPAAWRRKPEI